MSANADNDELTALLGAFEWHQQWEVRPGVFTPGTNSVERLFTACGIPADLTGRRVLDLGAWNGCCSFECERRGAERVVALSLEDPGETGFNALQQYLNSRVEYVRASVYSLSPDDLGLFDTVLFFGVLYHLRYPLLAFDQIHNVARGEVFVETHVIDDRFRTRRKLPLIETLLLPKLLATTPLWRQYAEYELHPEDRSNWFGPNIAAVIEGMSSAGFDCRFLKRTGDRATFRAQWLERRDRLDSGVYESYPPNRPILGG